MPTDDEQSNGAADFASSNVKEILVGGVTDASEDDGCHIQNRPRRSRTKSVKIRENREAEAEASKAVASNHSRPPLKDTTNLQIAPSVRIGYSSADDSNSLPSSCGATSPDSSDGDDDDDDDDCGYNDDDGSVSEAPSPPSLNDSGAATATDACVRSRVDNIHTNQHRPNYLEATERCDFSSIEDVNKWFPPYSSRGAFNCPQSLINAADTRKGKSLVVRDWRKLSMKQQSAKWDSILLAQQKQKQPSARKVRRASDVDTTSVQEQQRRKRRTLADDMNESEDERAWERVLTSNDRAAQRRNKKNERAREKTQQRKQQQQPTVRRKC
jgi:hypothetical protein